jgi:hypothetical protein
MSTPQWSGRSVAGGGHSRGGRRPDEGGRFRWDEPVEPIPAPFQFVRLRFFEGGFPGPTVSEVEQAFELTRRLLLRSHLLAQPFGASAGDATVEVARVTMASPLGIIAELPVVLQVVSGIGAVVTLAEYVSNTRPRVQAKRAQLAAIKAEADRQRAEAEIYLQGLTVGALRPDRVDISVEPQPSDEELCELGAGGPAE